MSFRIFSAFTRRRTPLINEEGEDMNALDGRGAKKPSCLQLCAQISLICACIVILFFGLIVTAVGLWGYRTQENYLTITENDSDLTRLPFSMMVTGVFVSILGLVGLTGSIFSRTITGQTLLGVFSFVLVLVIISELGAGAAAIHLKFRLKEAFYKKAEESQQRYLNDTETAENWDTFQTQFECCGAHGYGEKNETPYYNVFKNNSVPLSCCSCKEGNPSSMCQECYSYVSDATRYSDHIYKDGCPSKVIHTIEENMIVIAIIAIVVGSTQLLAVALAVLVAYMSTRTDQEKSSYSYNKLLQQEESSQATAS